MESGGKGIFVMGKFANGGIGTPSDMMARFLPSHSSTRTEFIVENYTKQNEKY